MRTVRRELGRRRRDGVDTISAFARLRRDRLLGDEGGRRDATKRKMTERRMGGDYGIFMCTRATSCM